jgi:hypothetical protein
VDDFDFEDLDPTDQVPSRKSPVFGLALPLVVLVIVVAVISGLVFGGVIQGHQIRVGPGNAPTTQSTVQIAP